MDTKKQFKRLVKQSNKMNSFLKKVSRTNTFRNKKGQSINEHIKELRKETTYSKEEKEEQAKQKIGTFEDL
jgi:hypothetical protein|tara:strand:+ start:25 stop:237 length:213 start_codon:yes stop_codon:yes gene_type:complete